MIAWLADHGVRIGLHHWGVAPGSVKTNLMTDNSDVRTVTMTQIKKTIDIGAAIRCVYVNIHPGARHLEKIDFAAQSQSLVPGAATPPDEAHSLLHAGVDEISAYARSKEIVLTVETLPGAEHANYERNQGWYDAGSASLDDIRFLAEQGFSIANDVTHTAASLARTVKGSGQLWEELLAFTDGVAAQTKLLHINTLVAPFDGTDTHNGLLDEDWQVGAWPSRNQLIALLSLFRHRDDVHVIPEPSGDMQKNYRALRELVRRAEQHKAPL